MQIGLFTRNVEQMDFSYCGLLGTRLWTGESRKGFFNPVRYSPTKVNNLVI